MSAKQAQDLIVELADLVEDLEALLLVTEAIPAALLKPLCADLGLAIERLGKHEEALAKAERGGRGKTALWLAGRAAASAAPTDRPVQKAK